MKKLRRKKAEKYIYRINQSLEENPFCHLYQSLFFCVFYKVGLKADQLTNMFIDYFDFSEIFDLTDKLLGFCGGGGDGGISNCCFDSRRLWKLVLVEQRSCRVLFHGVLRRVPLL